MSWTRQSWIKKPKKPRGNCFEYRFSKIIYPGAATHPPKSLATWPSFNPPPDVLTHQLSGFRYVMAVAAGRRFRAREGSGSWTLLHGRVWKTWFWRRGCFFGPQNDAPHFWFEAPMILDGQKQKLEWFFNAKCFTVHVSCGKVCCCFFFGDFRKNCSSNKHLVHYLICLAQCSWQKDISITALQTWHMQSNNPETLLMWQEKYVCNLFRFLLPVSQFKVIGFFSETI